MSVHSYDSRGINNQNEKQRRTSYRFLYGRNGTKCSDYEHKYSKPFHPIPMHEHCLFVVEEVPDAIMPILSKRQGSSSIDFPLAPH